MGIDEEDLLIRPFRDVVAVGATAATNAAALGPNRASDADRMSRAAQALVREGERALTKIQPVWEDRVGRYGDEFKGMMGQQASIEKRRLRLEELLWDFDDVTQPDEFDPARYSALQAATKALALDIVETAKRLKPTTMTALELPRGGFPPLPLLPPSRLESRPSRQRAFSKPDDDSNVSARGQALTPPASPDGGHVLARFPDLTLDDQLRHYSAGNHSDFGSVLSRSPSTTRTRTSLLSKSSSLTSSSALLGTPDTFYSTGTSDARPSAHYDTASIHLPPPALDDGGQEAEDVNNISPTTITPTHLSNTISSGSGSSSSSNSNSKLMSTPLNENRKSSRVNPRRADCNIDETSTYRRLKGLCKGAVRFRKDGHWGSIRLATEYGDGGGGGGAFGPGDMMRASDAIVPLQYEVKRVAGCGECGYAHDLEAIELDKGGDDEAITTSDSGAQYRLRLLFKSHLGKGTSGGSADDYYACLWCVSAGVTVRESDATVFRSADDLLQHLSRHPQPLAPIPGVAVCYGPLPAPEFDLHLPDGPVPVPMPDNVTRLATATATKDHHRRPGRGKLEKPPRYEGEMLEFMEGARIMGILFPEKWEGKWCLGRHDGAFGAFPAKAIELRAPQESEIPIGGESGMSVTARWKWTPPKSPPGAPWISLGKGETVTNVQCLYADYWCWYGTNSKGKTGVFPQSHLDLQTLKAQSATGSRRPSRGLHLFGR